MPDNPHEFIPTRQSLLSRLKDLGDQMSWQEFFDTYWKLIYSVALKAGLPEAEAKDVLQETVIAVARQMPTFKYDPVHGSFKAWLLKITERQVGHRLRKLAQEAATRAPPSGDSTHTPTLERIPDPASLNLNAVWEEEWRKNLVDAAMERVKRKVKARQYQIFDAYVVKEWPVEQVCRTLKVSATQVYLAKFRVAGLIKKEMKRLEGKAK
jgi:RNA polymerase sigma-70 factor (ECF subfamily)